MNCTNIMAGEVLEPGDMVFLSENQAYKVRDAKQIPRGVISNHHEIGDVVDNCILSPGIIEKLSYPDGCIGTAGEDLIQGGAIATHADGKWYNKRPQNTGGE